MRRSKRVLLALVAASIGAAVAAAAGFSSATPAGHPSTSASSCQLTNGPIKHVIYLVFDNVHLRQDVSGIPSDLQQMPHLLNFLTSNGTLFSNDHTILISHTAGGIISSLTGLYPDRTGITVSNSYDFYKNSGLPTSVSGFKYWTASVDGADDSKPNLITDTGLTTPAPWVPYTRAGCDVGGVSTANIELENNNAVTISGGPTPLAVAVTSPATTTNIKVNSTSGFHAGDTITIDPGPDADTPGPNQETAVIAAGGVGTGGAGGTGLTLTAPLTKTHAAGVAVYGSFVTDPAGDLTTVYGAGSPEWKEGRNSQLALSGTALRTLALTDFVGIAIHCAQNTTNPANTCATNPAHAKSDPLPDEPGGYSGFQGIFGAKYVNPAIGGTGTGNQCIQATDGSNITDTFNQCGFPGFDGALAKNTLGEVAQMQEHNIPVTYAYISDAHDNHQIAQAMGPGQAEYTAQLKAYDDAFAAFFQRLQNDGIDKSNTLFVVTADEGDHLVAGPGTGPTGGPLTYTHSVCPQASITSATTCPTDQIGEVNVKLASGAGQILPAGEPGFDIHFDDAPNFYVNGDAGHPNGPARDDASVRKLERDVGAVQLPDPYVNSVIPVADAMADTVEEKTLHMINADPKRTPTFTMFANADFFFQTTNLATGCGSSLVCVNPAFAWDHGDIQQEIANNWIGFVGPGVSPNGVDSTTWTDHTNERPTMLALLGLKDDYTDDGRVLVEGLDTKATPQSLRAHNATVLQLGQVYEQLNASFGQFDMNTLTASTRALKSNDAGDTTYTTIENWIASLTSQRDALAAQIRTALNAAAFNGQALDEQQAKSWIDQAQSLIDQSANPPA
jgi:hypothetical protein